MSKPKPPKKHHHVPRFYLAGFTDDQTKDGNVLVRNRQGSSWSDWIASPALDAVQKRNFNRLSDRAEDPYAFERLLAKFDAEDAPAFARLRASRLGSQIDTSDIEQAQAFAALVSSRADPRSGPIRDARRRE